MTTRASLATRPAAGEFAEYYGRYIAHVPEGDVVTTLRDHGRTLHTTLAAVPESHAGFRYAPGKWSIRDVVGHLIDAERIFTYRALRIARGDATPLASFDQEPYVAAARADERPLADLLDEMRAVREATVRLFAGLPAESWSRRGIASEQPVSVRALAFITAGHAIHHLDILRDKYALPTPA